MQEIEDATVRSDIEANWWPGKDYEKTKNEWYKQLEREMRLVTDQSSAHKSSCSLQ